ncbi:ABC transporter ATP-binding protein [Paraburkholderia azotifigens]|uniref:ATP-binding cassette domain-containing protein n=1 Tax=Paraburkholderia azotifigens TaxID=2057004 RepID=A0ABU9R681_9BURK|nr:ATP-binding cassette domain-containing protein [Paraburkholderia azotifigens]
MPHNTNINDAPLVEAHDIVRRDAARGQTLLHPARIAIHAGERIAITGPSGSGKSVFMRALALLDPLDGGEVRWRGRRIARATIPRFRRHVAYIRQRPALLDGTVEDNLRYPYTLHAYRDVRFDRERAAALASQAGRANDFLDRFASELSGGEAQIAALIRVLQLEPDVLLLDEPTASLDPESALAIEGLVRAWFDAAQEARAWLWVSHDPAQAARVNNRHLTMRAGVLDGPHSAASPRATESPR